MTVVIVFFEMNYSVKNSHFKIFVIGSNLVENGRYSDFIEADRKLAPIENETDSDQAENYTYAD